ncbi:sushi domain-containing protein 3 [Gouania willdenowi]|uniref:Sushi domain-containing protein 3-like n=1 Tax=Gouania willdenowi TaxID=441366 RepID=A0A8C5D354_GOUWI|nr:sushi domain-containing protein 3-like [Gouania willdenowi]
MSASPASVEDVSRTEQTNTHERRDRNNSVHPQAQCTPMALPALGIQRIIRGNGTNVGSVISLQCPAKHKLIGSDLTCIMGPNSPHWVGETYCKPLTPYGDYGFRVAVLASIVSLAIIFLMSVAFITCCLLDCIKEDNQKEQERETEMWLREEQEPQRSRYVNKGRNNNNNAHEKMLNLQDSHKPSLCRCQQSDIGAPLCNSGQSPLVSSLPGNDYNQPLMADQSQARGPSQGSETLFSTQTLSPGWIQTSRGCSLVQQYERQQTNLPGGTQSVEYEPNIRNININKNINPKEFSIRVISV